MEKSNIAKIISNYGSRAWNMISIFIFIPFYVQILGAEGYGLIGFFSVILGILNFADAGISSAVIREFSQENTPSYKYNVFRKLENYYLLICSVVFVLIFFLSGIIAEFSLNSHTMTHDDLVYYVKIIGLCVASHLITSLYYGAYFALNNQVKANLIQFLWSTCKTGVVIAVLFIFNKTIEVYFYWQIICNIVYVIVLRTLTIKDLKKQGFVHSEKMIKLPKHILDYLGGMVFIAIISSINFQSDKLITSSIFTLDIFGFYNLASSLSQIPVILATPLMLFVFPLFSKFANETDNSTEHYLEDTFSKAYCLISMISTGVSILIFLYAKEILLLWTKNVIPYTILNDIVFDLKMLIIGSFFLALQFPLYYLLISKGKTKYTIIQGVLQLCIGLPLLYFSSKNFGLKGVPFSWVFINFFSFIYLLIIVFKKKYIALSYTLFQYKTLMIPLISIVAVNVLFYILFLIKGEFFLFFAILGSLASVLCSIICINFSNDRSLLSIKHFYNFPQ